MPRQVHAVLLASGLSLAASSALAGSAIYTEDGVALGGTDPVAYFKAGEPKAGKAAHSLQWRGATWHFASAANRAAFAAKPEKYAPNYGGYCAYAAAKGYKAETVPEAWSIVDGELYLNFSLSVRGQWERKRQRYIRQADQNWPQLKDQ